MNKTQYIIFTFIFLILGQSTSFAQNDYYRYDKKPFKEIHLYKMGERIFVSGLNKDIDSLTTDDMSLLKKKCKLIEYDIYIARKYQNGELDIVDNNSCEVKSRLRTIEGNLPYNNINEYMIEHLSKSKFDGFNTSAIFIIEDDGALVCPIVLKGNNVEENKEVIRVLRKTKKCWLPAEKNGKYVRTMQGYKFSYRIRTVRTSNRSFRF